MNKYTPGYILAGATFMFLLWNFFTKEYSYHRNAILLCYIGGYTCIAIINHLKKNKKSD